MEIRSCSMDFPAPAAWLGAGSLLAAEIAVRIKSQLTDPPGGSVPCSHWRVNVNGKSSTVEPEGTGPGERGSMLYRIINKHNLGGKGSLLEVIVRGRRWASPDFEERYEAIEQWYCEVSSADGVVTREVGVDANGKLVSLGPIGRNAGTLVGIPLGSIVSAGTPASRERFEKQWHAALGACGKQVHELVRWRVTRQEIVGPWITAAFGGMSEEEIEFYDDGRVVLLARDADVFQRDSFRWEVPQPGVVIVDGDMCTDLDGEGNPRSAASTLHCERSNVTCRIAYDASGRPVNVLELDIGVEPYAWVHGPFWRGSHAAT